MCVKRLAFVAATAVVLVSCGGGGAKPPPEAGLPLLPKEAESIKADAEKPDPKMATLGVKTTWTVTAVEVQEQPGDKNLPYRGTIRFRIDSEMKEFDGTPLKKTLERKFEYVYDGTAKKW